MDLYDEIGNKLDQVNCIQLQGEKSVTTYLWNSDHFKWVESHNGSSQRVLAKYELIKLLAGIPHVTRRKGSVLIVSLIQTDIKIE